MVKRKELDVMLNIVKTEDRHEIPAVHRAYVKNPNVIVSSQKTPYESIEALFGKSCGLSQGLFLRGGADQILPPDQRLPVETPWPASRPWPLAGRMPPWVRRPSSEP
jgi:hypothetical protein